MLAQVVVSVVSEKCRIDTELLPSLFLRCTTDPLRREKYPAVTHLKFLTRENSEQVPAPAPESPLLATRSTGATLSVCVCVCVAGAAVCVQSERQHRGVLVPEEGGTSCQQHLPAPLTSR